MGIRTSGTAEKCVTCQYFAGTRSVDTFKRNVDHEAGLRGVCAKTTASKAGNQPGCSKWEKWGSLK